MTARLLCPCGAPADRLRQSRGVYAVYPCQHWLTPAQAGAVVAVWQANRDARAAA